MTDTITPTSADTIATGVHADGEVALFGGGRLHAALGERLHRVPPSPRAGAIVVSDDGPEGDYRAVRARAAEHRVPWLPVRVEAGWVLVGPATHPDEPGCPTCVARRRDGNRPGATARRALRARDGVAGPGGLLTPMVTCLIAAIVAAEVASGFPLTRGALLCVSVRTGALTRHPLAADPLCPHCGDLPEDRPVRLRLAAAPKPDLTVYRTRALPDDLAALYVDAETGLIGSTGIISARGVPSLPVAVARLEPGRHGHDSRHGYGRTGDHRSALRTAITEALERYSCGRPRGRRVSVRARFADIADRALDPRTLGLYPDHWYDQEGFRFARFDPEQEASWVWGYSFAADRPILIPLAYAYYGARTEVEPGWVYECSNGAALGGCLTEAILYGLLEVAERDAFLMTWYARLPVAKVDLNSVADRRIPLAVERVRQSTGYELMAFAMPMEQRVPAFWVLAVDRAGGPGRRYALCGAGAHLDAEHALRSALHEMLAAVGVCDDRPEAEAAAMIADGDLVREMRQHRQLYGHPDAYRRLAFLPADGPGRPLAELTEPWPAHEDLADDAGELIGRYLATGLDVIAVDTTSPELASGGFASAKVIVPGTASMTFGHRYRRTHDLPRLLTVPRLLGHRDRDLRASELNADPHPFP
ncbi:TOMM precursor leader peptide-binding protein [Streptosporangium sp. NBC_01639]|uniref:TOMM precursor leader peptide-binding protein n=1 Tax=Streptosporangium sp. NBC_01639 TaxID=2975948 RepID=UPI00386ECC43|nr:TOMM precursor leader peptide-binding protein [Streptosporangium sp. NBC_01639]